jgi:putative PIN family toxin of toxin-antitoxin system
MIRAVIDTSVLLRYLIRPSASVRHLIEELWVTGQVTMVTAPELIAEISDVLARPRMRAYVTADEGQSLLEAVSSLAAALPSLGAVPPYTRDPKDDKFVACAILGQADWVITFDNDLLTLGEIGRARIATPDEFLARVSSAPGGAIPPGRAR